MATPEQLADWQLLVDTIQMGEWRPSIFDTPGQQAIVALPEMMAEILLLQEQVKLAKAQRDSLDASCYELATKLTAAAEQIERENDLWVLMPATQEAIQLRWLRQKVQPTMKVDTQEILRMNRLSLNAVSVFQCTLNKVPEHAKTVMQQNMTLDDLRIVRDAASRMVQMLDVEIAVRVSQLPQPDHEHDWELYGDGSVSEGITFRYRVCTVCGVREEFGDA